MKNYKKVIIWLTKKKILFYQNYNLKKNSWLKTGGICNLFVCPENNNQFISLVNILRSSKLNFRIFGSTANCLFLDNINYGIIISTSNIKNDIILKDNMIVSNSGSFISDISRFALSNKIKGFEGFEGIPGTVGGAIVMNAGAYSSVIENVIIKVDCINKNGNKICLFHKDLIFNHRYSLFQKRRDLIILKCYFKCQKGNKKKIYKKMSLFHEKRHKYQEFIYPNLGSIFTGSLYKAMSKKNFCFKIIVFFDFIFFKKMKLFSASNNRNFLNFFACKIFNIKFKKKPFSDKNLNTLINNKNSSKNLIRYINYIKKVTCSKLKLENEIIDKF